MYLTLGTRPNLRKCFWPKWLRLDLGSPALRRISNQIISICLYLYDRSVSPCDIHISLINYNMPEFDSSNVWDAKKSYVNHSITIVLIQFKKVCDLPDFTSAGPSGHVKCEFSTTAHHSGSIGVLREGNWIRTIASVIHYRWCMVRCKQWFD